MTARAVASVLTIGLLWPGQVVAQKQRQPETIMHLIESMDYTFPQILTPDEFATVQGRLPEEVQEVYPELYQKIRQNVKHWTDDWVRQALKTHGKLSREKLDYATNAIVEVDSVLRPYFEERGWPYRTINAVFLPQRLFVDRRRPGGMILGLFIPYYPEVFFATVNPDVPTHMILVHETIHFNMKGPWIGQPLTEGITDAIARRLSLQHGLVTEHKANKWATYGAERSGRSSGSSWTRSSRARARVAKRPWICSSSCTSPGSRTALWRRWERTRGARSSMQAVRRPTGAGVGM
jgi:hypothetical protein